jgi:hypothetical protein
VVAIKRPLNVQLGGFFVGDFKDGESFVLDIGRIGRIGVWRDNLNLGC